MAGHERGGGGRWWLRWATAGITVLALVGCFEEPIEERLSLVFHPDGSYEVKVVTTISNQQDGDGNRALARRLAETRRTYEQGLDPWATRFPLLEPGYDKLTWERDQGVLVRVERCATASGLEALARFLADASLVALVNVDGGRAALEISPGAGSRASRSQRDRVEELVASWSDAVARTLRAAADLHEYLDRDPLAIRPCLAALFEDMLPAEDRGEKERMNEEARTLVEEVIEARKEVLGIFEVPEDEAYSLNELSHLVYDPFPSRLTVSVPGEPLRVEGFERGSEGTLVVAGLGLYEALQTLAGSWTAPDPIVVYVDGMRSGGPRPSLAELAELPRRAVAPTASEVRQALEDRLRPAPLYRVVWALGREEEEPPQE